TGGLPRADRAAQRTRERALSLLGFRPLRPGLEVRPDNLDQDAAELAARLEELGLDAGVPVFRAEGLGVAEEEAATLWDAAELDGRCAALLGAVEALEAEMPALSWEAGACESFRVGGAVLRHFAYDPLLPAPIVDVALRHALVEAMARLDAIGRECWREALHEEREEDAA
ncbi:MAG TPA: hypothetical protein RMG45_23445, partial [Polyangiaceae bacterium LLY-WYZ-15_(1-7)]|nr:hypothetical protein [Polyangiaceae bacterium LLY-WYZ-15_(1-7)]